MNNTHHDTVARRKIGPQPELFGWYAFQVVGDAIMFTGCVSTGRATKGKRKGRLRYDGPKIVAIVTDLEAKQEYERFEREEGECGECMGTGRVFASWHHIDGTKYATCRKCNGKNSVPTEALASPTEQPASSASLNFELSSSVSK